MSQLIKRLQKRSLKQEQIDEKTFEAAHDESCRQWIMEQREHLNDNKESQEAIIINQQAELNILLDRYNIALTARDQFHLPRYKGQMKEDETFSSTEKELHTMFRDALKHFIQRFNGNSLANLRRYETQVKSHLIAIAQGPDRLAILDRIAASYAPTLINTSEIDRQYLSYALTRVEHPTTLTGIFNEMIQQMIKDGLLQAERRTAVKLIQGKRSILEYKTSFDKYIEKIDGYSAITHDINTNAQLKARIFNDFISGLRYNLRMLTNINELDHLSYSDLVAKFVAAENRIGVQLIHREQTSKPNQQSKLKYSNSVVGKRDFREQAPVTFSPRRDIHTPARPVQPRHNPSEVYKKPTSFSRNGHHNQNNKYQSNAPTMFCFCFGVSAWECQLVPSYYGDLYRQGLYNTFQVSVVQLARLQKPCHKISPWKLKFVVGRAIFHTVANESVTIKQNVDGKSCEGFTTFKSHDGLDYMVQILQSSKSTHPLPELQQGRQLLLDIFKHHKRFNDSCQSEVNIMATHSIPVITASSTTTTSSTTTLSVTAQPTSSEKSALAISKVMNTSPGVAHSPVASETPAQANNDGIINNAARKRKQHPINKKIRDEGCGEELVRLKKEYSELQIANKDLEQRLTSLESLFTQRDKDYTFLKARHDKLENEYVEKTRLLNNFHDEEIAKLKHNFSKEKEDLVNQHSRAIDAVTSKLSLQNDASQLKLEQTYKEGIARIQQNSDNDKKQLVQKHQAEIDKLNKAHRENIDELNEINKKDIQHIHDEHRKDLHTFTTEWSERLQKAMEKKNT